MYDEKERDETHHSHHDHHFGPRNWMKHTAMVPKGFIRFHVLEALSEKPMSGSEIMEQIQKQTGSFWKPSPGSIYPLLAWLQDNSYVKELPSENGLKRYELTPSGKELFSEQETIRNKVREEVGFMPGQFFDNFTSNIPSEKMREIRDSMRRFAKNMFQVGKALHVIDETSRRFEEINQKLKGVR